MPEVSLDMDIQAPATTVWRVVTDIERYADSMESVRWVKILDDTDPRARRSEWSVLLKGSILQWEEAEDIDTERMVMSFHQLDGDMETFDGHWRVVARGGHCRVTLHITFEIGIPLLADMLNPVAEKSLRENVREMLRGVERDSLFRTRHG